MNAAANDLQERELHSSATDAALMTAITKAELDQAVVAAHAHPRSVKQFLDECRALATLNEQIADDCIYAIPRKEGGQTKMIEGPSARLSEIVAHSWGNCRVGARVVEEGREYVRAQGVFQDLEKNVHITYEVSRRITNRDGRRYSADMIGVTGNAACSIALRNAVFKGVPKAFWGPIYEEAQRVCRGDAKTLANRRSEALAFLQKMGATKDMVLALLGVKGVEDITLDHLVLLRGIATAIKEGETTVEESFAPKESAQAAAAARADAAKDALRQQQPGATTAQAAQQGESDAVPQFDEATALAELRKANTLPKLEAARAAIWKDFAATKRELPLAVEATHNELRDALRTKGEKL